MSDSSSYTNKLDEGKKRSFSRVEFLELFMLFLVVLLFIFFLIVQSRVAFFDKIKSQIILIDILLAIAIIILFSKFVLDFYNIKLSEVLKKTLTNLKTKKENQ
ncbi:MAG: hypothetical protein K9W46_10315 [Candidatus Heimdallarchaeum endolithica]|uniref:Uncharacterized protein n=1 Tax=Candidatus Heimdallarchaeum endolithica TaxID=2876572 RepID=A0A9Y1BPB7_9ARCH|nr:MAG: hypothetical protein K9W46_10315 [Candidatus Heimdallarchaeum endolithica]